MNVGDLWVRISVRMDELNKGLNEAEAQIKATEKRLNGFATVGERLSGIGQKMTMGITLPLVGIAGASVKMATDFNASMADVSTLIPGNVQRVEELKTVVQNMAVETGRRTGDLSRGLYQVISAFGDTADTAKILETNARAAVAGLATTEQAIALTSAVTKGYGDTSAEAVAKAADLAVLTARLGQTTFPELAGSIGRVTPLASAMGVSMEELFGTMATLNGVTGTAAEVSTQLRGTLQGLMDPSENMQDVLESMGYASGTAALESLGLQGVLQGLATQTGGNKEALAGLFGSIEAGTAVLALTGGQSDVFSQRLKDMGGYAGATDTAFRAQTEGVNEAGFAIQQMISRLQVVAQEIADVLLPVIADLVENYLKPAVEWFSGLDEEQKKLIITIAGVTAAIGLLLTGIGLMIPVLLAVKGVLLPLKVAFLAVTAKVWIVIGAIAALAAGGYFLITRWDEVKAFLLRTWDAIKAKGLEVWNGLITYFTVTVPSRLEALVEWFRALPEKIGSFLQTLATETIPYWIGFALGTMARLVIEGIAVTVEFFRQLPGRVLEFLVQLGVTIRTSFNETRVIMQTVISNAVTTVVEFFRRLPGQVWDFLTQLPARMREAGSQLVAAARTAASDAAEGFMSFVSNLPDRVWDSLMSLRDTIRNAAGALLQAAFDAASSLWEGFKAGIGDNSPTYIERTMTRIMETSQMTLETLKRDFQALGRLQVQPKLALGTPQFGAGGSAAAPAIDYARMEAVMYTSFRNAIIDAGKGEIKIDMDGTTVARMVIPRIIGENQRQGVVAV